LEWGEGSAFYLEGNAKRKTLARGKHKTRNYDRPRQARDMSEREDAKKGTVCVVSKRRGEKKEGKMHVLESTRNKAKPERRQAHVMTSFVKNDPRKRKHR